MFSNRELFAGLFKYVKNNQNLPNGILSTIGFISGVYEERLLDAIRLGEHEHPIFSDPLCDLCLLRLIQNGRVEFYQGITVYIYLMALAQFSPKQELREEDIPDCKRLDRPMAIVSLATAHALTVQGQEFLRKICTNFEKIGLNLNKIALELFIIKLAPVDKWLLELTTFVNEETQNIYPTSYDRILCATIEAIPFIATRRIDRQKSVTRYACLIPSFAIINYIKTEVFKNNSILQPFFGSIKQETLDESRKKQIYLLGIYSKRIQSNTKTTHNLRCGPLPHYLHDLTHSFAIWLLTPYLPIIAEVELKLLNWQRRYPYFTKDLAYYLFMLRDFNLTPLKDFSEAQTRFWQYLACVFSIVPGNTVSKATFYPQNTVSSNTKDAALSNLIPDHLLLLIYKEMVNLFIKNVPQEDNIWYKIFLHLEKTMGPDYRNPNVIQAIKNLAVNFSADEFGSECALFGKLNQRPIPFLSMVTIDWQAWQELLISNTTSEAIWKAATSHPQRHTELLALINQHGLVFFHPIIPLSMANRGKFLQFIQQKCSSVIET